MFKNSLDEVCGSDIVLL